jgi:hypothetical protein
MHGNKKEKLNFNMIFLSIVMLMSGLVAKEGYNSFYGENIGILSSQVLSTYFGVFPSSKNSKVNDFKLINKVDEHNVEH